MKTFLIETGLLDSAGNIVELDGLTIPDKNIVVTQDFDANNPLGVATVVRDEDGLKATFKFFDEKMDGYPAIGFIAKAFEANGHGGYTFKKTKLTGIAISIEPNVDARIKRLSEQ